MAMISRALTVGSALAAASCLVLTTTAQADVAYIDGNEVWVSTLNGQDKIRLSGGEGDWRDVAVSSDGYVVGVQLESGKIADLSRFTVWDPQGQVVHFGPLVGLRAGASNAHPLNLQITPGGGLLIYGFSSSLFQFPVNDLQTGFIILPSATRTVPALQPLNVKTAQYPAVIGQRVIGATSDTSIGVQQPGSPANTDFSPWLDLTNRINGLAINTAGTRLAVNVETVSGDRLLAIPTDGLGLGITNAPGSALTGDCFVPTNGDTYHPSYSPDGAHLAWGDAGGVKVAGAPLPTADPTCVMSGPTVTISPTGKYPALGPVSVSSIRQTRNPVVPGGGSGGTPAPPAPTAPAPTISGSLGTVTVSTLASKKGSAVTVQAPRAGRVTITLTVRPGLVGAKGKKPIVIAKGAKSVPAGASKVRMKFTPKGKALRTKLKGKRVTLRVSLDGTTTTRTFRLR